MIKSVNISLRQNPGGYWPAVDATAYIDTTAQIIGNVRIGPQVYVGPNVIIRADEADYNGDVQPIEIGPECNVQDGVIIHALAGTKVVVGQRTSLGHGCIVHGPCTIGQGCFIGFRAVVFKATLEDGVFVGASTVVHEVDLAPKSLVPPAVSILSTEHVAELVSTTSPTDCAFMEKVVTANLALTRGYNGLDRQNQM